LLINNVLRNIITKKVQIDCKYQNYNQIIIDLLKQNIYVLELAQK
jgi:hypothetical protein